MPCQGVVCPLGARCDADTDRCVADRCFGVACPTGSACVAGVCLRVPPPDAGLRDVPVGRDVGPVADVPRTIDGGTRPMDAGADGGELLVEAPDQGCVCRAGPVRAAPGRTVGLATLLAGAMLLRRPRRRRAVHRTVDG